MPLPLPAPALAAADAAGGPFIEAPSNAAALSWLAHPGLWPAGRLLLVGEAGSGKSHLLAAWAAGRGGLLVAGAALALPPPRAAALAIDDAEQCAQAALLHALNATAEAGGLVLLSARRPAARWATGLPDLASRLRATQAAAIGRAEDSLLRLLLSKMLAERQLAVPEAARDVLHRHLPRTPAAMRDAAARLARASAQGGRITQAVAAAIVDEVIALREDDLREEALREEVRP